MNTSRTLKRFIVILEQSSSKSATREEAYCAYKFERKAPAFRHGECQGELNPDKVIMVKRK